MFYQSFWYIELKIFRLLGNETSSGLSKKHSTCPKERFEGLFFFGTNIYFPLLFPEFESETLGLFTKKIRQVCQNCILKVQRNLLGNTFWKMRTIFFFVHRVWPKTIRNFGQKFLAGLSKMHSNVRRYVLKRFSVGKRTYIFLPFPDFK